MTSKSLPNESGVLHRVLAISSGIVGAEALLMFALAGWLWLDIFSGFSRSLPAAISLAAIALAVAVWVGLTGLRLLENRRWARSSAIFWQTCQLAVASASFTGQFAQPAIGVGLILPSLAVLILLFTKPVLRDAKEQLERG